jgi:RNA polymerase sigma-70 factor (ECF subfamily)
MDKRSLVQQSKSIEREEEQALVHRCRRGDREAFARLMQLYQKQIYNYTYRMLGSEEEAEDLTQDVFVAAFRGMAGFRGEAKFSTWLYRIALNQTRNRIKYLSRRNFFARRSRRTEFGNSPTPDYLESVADTGPSPEQLTMTKDLALQVQDCLNQLGHRARQILVLRDVQGFSYEELSEMLSLNLGTVKSRLHRARTALQKCLLKHVD